MATPEVPPEFNPRTRPPGARGRMRPLRLAAIAFPALLLAACNGDQSMLDTAGRGARDVAGLWWLMFWLGTAVFVVVLAILGVALVLRRPAGGGPAMGRRGRHRMVVLGGIILPVLIIAVVFTTSSRVLLGFADMRESSDVRIEVIAHQFWWEVHYPDHGVVTANEIHVPVDRTVELRLTSNDVIHSFSIPSLHPKIDMLPGKTTSITIQPETVGTFRGQCAQFCGAQHANMAFLMIVQDEADFDAWVQHQTQPAEQPSEGSLVERGRDIYMSSACVYCHTIAGTPSNGTLGPDLTHLASRETIAAGMLENNPGNLAGWIIDPQHIKPGSAMPGVHLTGEELQALLDYLNSLD